MDDKDSVDDDAHDIGIDDDVDDDVKSGDLMTFCCCVAEVSWVANGSIGVCGGDSSGGRSPRSNICYLILAEFNTNGT